MSHDGAVARMSALVVLIAGVVGCDARITHTTVPRSEPESRGEPGQRGASSTYFPLNEGDIWVYARETAGPGSEMSVEVTDRYELDGRIIHVMEGYTLPHSIGPLHFYEETPGTTREVRDGRAGTWYPWSRLSSSKHLPVEIPELADDCIHGTSGSMTGFGSVTVPVGTFAHAITITYDTHPCADVAVVREVFAPGVGLIERTASSFLGEETWSLVYAEVGGETWSAPAAGGSGEERGCARAASSASRIESRASRQPVPFGQTS